MSGGIGRKKFSGYSYRTPSLLAVAVVSAFASASALAVGGPPPCSPVPQISPDNQTVNENVSVQLNGQPSKDSTSYLWTQTLGPTVTLSSTTVAKPTFTAPSVGSAGATLKFSLTTKGCSPEKTSSAVETTITVLNVADPNQPPVAGFTVSPATVYWNDTVTLDASGSYDPNNDALTYKWEQIDIVSGVTPVVTLSSSTAKIATFTAPYAPYPDGVSLHFKLTVSDGTLTGTTDKYVTVTWANVGPTAKVSCPLSVDEGKDFTLNGSGSSDPDDGIVAYAWSQTLGGPIATMPVDLTTSSITAAAPSLTSSLDTMSFKLEVTDMGGLKHSATCDVKVNDITNPTAAPTQDPAANSYGWNNTNVKVDWHWSDAGVGIDDANCTKSSTSSGEGNPITLNAKCSDLVGNEGSADYDVKVDKTKPTISAAPTPASANGANGWYVSPVTVKFTCNDNLSGLAGSCPPDQLLNVDGNAVSSTAEQVTDKAGNVSEMSNVVTVKIDQTKPTISAAATTVPDGDNGWYKSDVSVAFTCDDAMSGIPAGACPTNQVLSAEGNPTSSTAKTVKDNAGNESDPSNVVSVKLDKTAPTITAAATPSSPNGNNGWYTTNVAVDFTCNDNLSGVAGTCPAQETLTEGASVKSTAQTIKDNAGNVSDPSNVITANIDTTSPGITWSGTINDGDSFYFGFVPAVPTCSATDSLSGPDVCAVSGYATTVGQHTLKATAYDKAGNKAESTRAYTVKAWTLNGFYQPVDMGNVWNTVKGGSTVPLKFEIFAGSTELTDVKWVKGFSVYPVACGATLAEDAIEMTSTGGTTLRYDATGGQFIQNWQTPKSPGACFIVQMTTMDGSSLTANFKLK